MRFPGWNFYLANSVALPHRPGASGAPFFLLDHDRFFVLSEDFAHGV